MNFLKKVMSDCLQPIPRDEPEVPDAMKNPYTTSFLQRVLLRYQVMPDGHPYNAAEKLQQFTPETLKDLEEATLMPESDKVEVIRSRDARWNRGIQAKVLPKAGSPEYHQHKIAVDTVKNPAKGLFLGGPNAQEAEEILRSKFKYTDDEIKKLKG